ncbi:chorismate mutase [Aeropyrum pernix K1]|uniref:Chorismate mutase n=1 Tax=Aeropyrum pernix (strain ATCC 700893 / DSM 11879 / JCM 9820 / NBRC 100138 / K1) TaxID=272557 RepID=Q05E63_AERPE|nr:chorismate mutase [Aeropyrum pernix]BAF34738.1 chorismate mutase [Aeropyrum pernix K1]
MGIEEARRLIDELDAKIVALLEERLELCRRVGEEKRRLGRGLRDEDREAEVLGRVPSRWRPLYRLVIEECLREQARGGFRGGV